MQARITKQVVDRTEPAARDVLVWDTTLKGFGLKVTVGGAKVYIVQYRLGGRGTKTKRFTIGNHGSPWTADHARDKASEILAAVALGRDPVAEHKAKMALGFTVAELADRYVSDHLETKNRPGTRREARRLVERVIKPRLGSKTVAHLSRDDVATMHHRMRGTPRQANQTLAVLSKMLSLAELWGHRPDGSNPCRHIARFEEAKRERFLSDAEVTALGQALADAATTARELPQTLDAVRLLLLVGCRVGELLALRWEDVDLQAGALTIREAKAGGRVQTIGAQCVAYLKAMHRSGAWVIPAAAPKKPMGIFTLEHAWRRIRAAAKLDDVRLHDLRHTHGTFAGQTGANAYLVRDALGHKTISMTGRYVNRDADPLRILADKVGERISAALGAGAAGKTAEVVKLPRRG